MTTDQVIAAVRDWLDEIGEPLADAPAVPEPGEAEHYRAVERDEADAEYRRANGLFGM